MNADVDVTLAALADPARRALVGMLSRQALTPSEMAEALSTTRPTISRHLRVLRHAGLVKEELQVEDARVRVYQLCQEPFGQLQGWLEDVAAFWTDQLDAFKQHAERDTGKQ